MLFICFALSLSGEKEDKVLAKLSGCKGLIGHASKATGISSRIIASVIYTEQTKNYNWEDALFDNAMARSGYNSSLGFAQVKVNTAYWLESELNTPAGKYYLGTALQHLFKPSRNRDEVIERLTTDSTNILYCAAYLEMIKKRWMDCGYTFTQGNEPGMLGTLYSLGIIDANGNDRLPHAGSRVNEFGRMAQEFFNSFVLRSEFN